MKPRYAIVNENERDEFERNWQLPYGYNSCIVSCDFYTLKDSYDRMHASLGGYIIEKYENGIKERVYPVEV